MKTMTLTSNLRSAGLPLMAAAVLASLGLGASAHAASWVVSSGQSIQSAITNAAAGDNITVMMGTYNENLTITNGLTIQGSGGPVSINGVVTVQNASLPVYFQYLTLASDLNISGSQNVRVDQSTVKGTLNANSSTIYCYKDTINGNANFSGCTWTFQRIGLNGAIGSSSSIAKFIGSSCRGFTHNSGEVTIFQSTIWGWDSHVINLSSTDNAWVCYNTISHLDVNGGNAYIIANTMGGENIQEIWWPGNIWGDHMMNTLYISGGSFTIMNNVFYYDNPFEYGGWKGCQSLYIEGNVNKANVFNNTFDNQFRGIRIAGTPNIVNIQGNIISSFRDYGIYCDSTYAVIDHNLINARTAGTGVYTYNIGGDPQYNGYRALQPSSPCINAGPTNNATFLNFDGTQNTMGASGGHSFDTNGWGTTNPVVLSGSVSPLYVKQGQPVTISARAAVIAAP